MVLAKQNECAIDWIMLVWLYGKVVKSFNPLDSVCDKPADFGPDP